MKKAILIIAAWSPPSRRWWALGSCSIYLENIEEHFDRVPTTGNRVPPPFTPPDATDLTYNNQLDYADWRWRFHFESVEWIEQLEPLPLAPEDCVPGYRNADEVCAVPAHIDTYCFVWKDANPEHDVAVSVAVDVSTKAAFAWRWPRSKVCE